MPIFPKRELVNLKKHAQLLQAPGQNPYKIRYQTYKWHGCVVNLIDLQIVYVCMGKTKTECV